MSKEWNKNNRFNPFNSSKILLWRKHIEACYNQNYLIPPMVDIDLSPYCNYSCRHCNGKGIIDNQNKTLSTEHFLKLADFLRDWRIPGREEKVVSCCLSGGGESLMHKDHTKILTRLYENGIETGVITNGSLITTEGLTVIPVTCKWIGFSMDAATPETYNKIKFNNATLSDTMFNKVCSNLKQLSERYRKLNKGNGTCFKFLLSPTNYNEIYEAAKLAKSLGVYDFHLRPVSQLNLVNSVQPQIEYTAEMLKIINEQITEAQTLESSDFKVYTIKHKFTNDFQPILKFNKCRLIPMIPTFGADGYVHTCFDIRGREDLIMCKHFEIEQYWNSDAHKKQIDSIDISKCPRCTMNGFHEIAEQVFIGDNMCRNFL